jgi:hypothetical protein
VKIDAARQFLRWCRISPCTRIAPSSGVDSPTAADAAQPNP